MGAMSGHVVRLRDVFCVHRTAQGDAASLQGLDLELERGEIVCVLGPSGAGKTTLLRVIAGLQLPSAGSVRLLDRDIGRVGTRERAALRHRHVGFLGQSSEETLAPVLSAKQALTLPLALRGVGRCRREARAEELLDAVRLRDRADARPIELSGGERQRVALCAALAHAPTLLLADEPSGELDQASAISAYEVIVSLVRSAGASAIIASHDPLAENHADRTIGLRDGRVVEERSKGATILLVGRGGWVQLPRTLQATARLGNRVTAREVKDGVLLARAADGEAGCFEQATPPAGSAVGPSHEPVRVELTSVSRSYGEGPGQRAVLTGFSHDFAAGQLTVVTGRSGSGKTTLLRLIAGLDRPTVGQITIDGLPLGTQNGEQLARLRRQRIGLMPQDPTPVAFLTAHENVVLALSIRGWDEDLAARRAQRVLDLVGLSERARQRASRLSAGEIQRLALARGLAGACGLLLIDEPTSRLDEANAGRVAALLAHAASSDEQTVICATHDPAVIAEAAEIVPLER
jgi:ABC-type lipoprotein export system ATPase subunit